MRHIVKNELNTTIKAALSKAQKSKLSWEDFDNQHNLKNGDGLKAELQYHLEDEQHGLCGYSEVSLSEFKPHIEHIRPQGKYPASRFDENNLIASSSDSNFAGHKKGNQFDETLFISPTQPDCARFFQFAPNGDIKPHRTLNELDTKRAEYTIECLGLQCQLLINKRRNLFESLNAQIEVLLDQPEALLAFKEHYTSPNKAGELKPFSSIMRQVFA